MGPYGIRKLAAMAALTALALVVFAIEAQIPAPIPVQGAQLGLANAVTLFALFYRRGGEGAGRFLRAADVLLILICRIVLGALFTGRVSAIIYSMAGGLLGFAAQTAVKRLVTDRQIWVCGAAGAVFHNVGQIFAAILMTRTAAVALFLPQLIFFGVITGVITGLAAQFAVSRIK